MLKTIKAKKDFCFFPCEIQKKTLILYQKNKRYN